MSYGALSSKEVAETLTSIRARIGERFPKSGLLNVAAELAKVVRDTQDRALWVGKVNVPLRVAVTVFILGVLGVTFVGLMGLNLDIHTSTVSDFVQMLEAGVNDVILLSVALYFLVTFETRVKRTRVLKVIHELRSVAHIIDMHQLTKDPDRLSAQFKATLSSPEQSLSRHDLYRYLDYCSELLSIVSKVAAIYAQHFNDPVVLSAVDEIEDLTGSLSNKIWQKIMILQTKAA